MDIFSTFDKLVAELSDEERRKLLEKINASASVTKTSVGLSEPGDTPAFSLEEELENVGFFKRLILVIKSFFKGISLEEALLDDRISGIKREIEVNYPGLIDFKRKLFLPLFRDYIADLKVVADFFRSILLFAFEKKRELFFAYMVNSELTGIHQTIREELSPEKIRDEMLLEDKYEIKREMERKLKDILESITPDEKKRVYRKILFLYGLYRLTTIDFMQILDCFRESAGSVGCPFKAISGKLVLLGEILFNFHGIPSAEVFQVLFIFSNEDMLSERDANFGKEMNKFITNSLVMLEKIRNFTERIPLIQIIRYIKRDPRYTPARREAIDDWFYSFKNFWDRWLAASFRKFSLSEDRRNILYTLREYLDAPEINYLSNYRGEKFEFPITMGFLNTFVEYVFVKHMSRGLKILLVNGDFYKEANREVFTDSYNWLNNLDKTLEAFDSKLDKYGEIGKEIEKVESEIAPLRLKNKKIAIILSKADKEAEEIINKHIEHTTLLIKVLEGILYGEVGGEYDTISNFTEIGGRENQKIVKSWKNTLSLLDRAVILVKDSHNIEASYWQSLLDSAVFV